MTNHDNISYLKTPKRTIKNHGGEPPKGNDLERRVEALEKAIPDIKVTLARLEAKVDSIEKHGATKEDIAKLDSKIETNTSKLEVKISEMQTSLIKWFIGTAVVLSGATGSIAFFILRISAKQ